MKLHIPTEQYGFVDVELDLDNISNWKTAEENIENAFKFAAYAKQEYKKVIID